MDTYVDLGTIYAEAAIEFTARAQEDRLMFLKSLEAQEAPDAVVSEYKVRLIRFRTEKWT